MSKFKPKEDVIRDPRQKYSFTEYMAALDDVFASVFFRDVNLRNILWDSYRMNVWDLALYAIENKIDEIEYINSICQHLLAMPGCRLRQQER